jgi:membrane glycosyltransferase
MSILFLGMMLGLPHLEMAGWGVFIAPNTKLVVGEKLLLSSAHRTIRWCTGQCTIHCPVRLVVGLTPQATVGA